MRSPSTCTDHLFLIAALALAAICGNRPALGAPPGAVPAKGSCGTGTLYGGERTVTLKYKGVARDYIIHVPKRYNGTTLFPLVLDLHGLTSNAQEQAAISGWREKSNHDNMVVIWPNGLDQSWNGGALCCGKSQANHVDDEGFLRAVVAKTRAEGCIDPKRIYATGLSNGGAMAHLLACRDADVFAATAPVSMGNGTVPCAPSRPITVTMWRGTKDVLVPYGGGPKPSAAADFEQWKTLDHCTGTPETIRGCQTYTHCAGGVEVTLCSPDSGHVPYAVAAAKGAPIPDFAWVTFMHHPMP